MKRREFIKKSALAAGAVSIPYILPSGRLFAKTGNRLVNHVVFVLFGGGIRNQEAVNMHYLSTQPGFNTEGNIMENMLKGVAPSQNLVYNKWSPILQNPLSEQGTLFKEMRYAQGPTGHFNGHTVAMTGTYTETGLNLTVNPNYPTIFEYYRKHHEPERSAINAWWLSEGLGPYTALNFSSHPDYGPTYGANYLRPATTFSDIAETFYADAKEYQPDDLQRILKMREFLNGNFDSIPNESIGIQNTEEDKEKIQAFILDTYNKAKNGTMDWATPSNQPRNNEITGDLINISYAWQVLDTFSPELTVINTFNLDICHQNFSQYLSFLHRADYGVGWLWNKIQEHPVLANDTIMICMPEHGRNLQPNSLIDNYGLNAFDHTSDDNSRRVFSLIVGPPNIVNQGKMVGDESSPVGESIDVVPTIANILGFDHSIPPGMLRGRVLNEAFK